MWPFKKNPLLDYNFLPGIPWPWEDVNKLTRGLTPGLHVIAARPSVGKTSFALQCLTYWCQLGYKVAINSLDMAEGEMIKRPVAILARVSPGRSDYGFADEKEMTRVEKAAAKVIEWGNTGHFLIAKEYDVDKLKAWAEIQHAAGRLDILVIDFAQRFSQKGRGASEYETVTYASGVLKQLANECNMPVVLLSQLSRDSQKAKDSPRPPELSDLRGSGALEQDATTVVLLHKDREVNDIWKKASRFTDEMAELQPQVVEALRSAAAELEDLVPPYANEHARDETRRALAAVHYDLAKNQNGPTGEVPFVVFQNCFRWFVGDPSASGRAQYKKLKLDWRAEGPELCNAVKNRVAIEPEHWLGKYAEELGRLGLPMLDITRHNCTPFQLERYRSTEL